MDESGGEVAATGACLTRLTCLACGRVVPYTEAELLEYIKNGLPRCCGESMTIAPRTPPAGNEAPRPG